MSQAAAENDRIRWQRVRDIFAEVSEAAPSQQNLILDNLTAGEPLEVVREVKELLALQGSERLLTLDAVAPRITGSSMASGTVLSSRYRIERFLASGGMGDVYAATDLDQGIAVAVKMIRPFSALERDAEARLLREAKLAGRVDHPNVCRVRGIDTHGEQRFCVMDLLEGETLADRIRREGALPHAEALRIAFQLCDGLEAAHAAGVLHRDLKPGNIFLVQNGARAVLIDFGLATAAAGWNNSGSLTSAGAVIGTLAYVAPEQLEGRDATPASDIYCLGVVFHEMLTGRKPHAANSPFRMARQKVSESHRKSLTAIPGLPAIWNEVLTRCLRANPRSRYQQIAQVRHALQRKSPSLRYLASRRIVLAPMLVIAAFFVFVHLWRIFHAGYQPRPEAEALYRQAEAALTQASPRTAASLLMRSVAADPAFLKARATLAIAHAEIDQLDQARRDVVAATEIADRRWLLGTTERLALHATRSVVMRDFAAAARFFGEWSARSNGVESTYAAVARGRMLEHAGQTEEALAAYEYAVARDPSNPAARVYLATRLAGKNQNRRAVDEFDLVAKAFRGTANLEGLAHVLLARSAALQDRPVDEDQRDLDEAFAASSAAGNRYQALSARFRMAALAIRTQDYDGAAAIARETAEQANREELEGLAAQSLGELGNALIYAGRPGQAVPALEEAVELARRSGSHDTLAANRLRLGEALYNLRRFDDARDVIRPAVEWYRQNQLESHLAHALIKYGTAHQDAQSRIAHFEEALALAKKTGRELYESMALQRLISDWMDVDPGRAAGYSRQAVPLARKVANYNAIFRSAEALRDSGFVSEARALTDELRAKVQRGYRPGLSRDRFLARIQLLEAETLLVQGDCPQGWTSYRSIRPELLSAVAVQYETTGARLKACAGGFAGGSIELARVAASPGETSSDVRTLIARAEASLAIGQRGFAFRIATRGMEDAQRAGRRLHELHLMLIRRAASPDSRESAAMETPILTLARRIGFDSAGAFNGRKDLVRLWRAAPVAAPR
jgi:tetratricopeptide (TPR) repeat protein/predicted Ser/Thr protein kinase